MSTALAHDVALALSAEAPFDEIMAACAVPLLRLAQARSLTLLVREPEGDRIAFRSGEPSPACDQLAAEALAADAVIVRTEHDRHRAALPVSFGASLLGALAFDDAATVADSDIAALETCALQLGARMHLDRALRSAERYAALALTDGLTGIANRRRFDETLVAEWVRGARDRIALTALVLDIDHFKWYNDHYGHEAGDLCLRQLAHALAETVRRPTDLFARYGGEEFVALLPGTDLQGGITLAETMRAAVHGLNLPHERSARERVSISIGVATLVPDATRAPEALFRAADDALYQAKRLGRDRVSARGYASDGDPTRRASATPTNLPLLPTHLIGRREEVAHIVGGLGASRLVTVVGPGGTGKTRAALQAANEMLGSAPDGVWFVDLSALSDASNIPTTIAELFGIRLPSSGALDALTAALGDRDALLVLDNCEHVLDGLAPIVTALLLACPRMRLIATSRAPLGVQGEMLYRLPLLDATDAAALFIDRVRAVRPEFLYDAHDEALVREICRRLDGIALAIELAAARTSLMSLRDLAAQLDERFGRLAGADRTALPRQQTMRATLDWSYALLDPAEAVVFRRIAIFAGTFSANAAMTVCASGTLSGADVFTALNGLVRKSLVLEDPSAGEPRFRLLETVLEYANERLEAAGETAAFARRHAEWVNERAIAGEHSAHRIPSRDWLAARRPDLDNDRAALVWAFGPHGDVELGASIAAELKSLFSEVAHAEGIDWCLRALDALGDDPPPRLGALLCSICASSERFPAQIARDYGDRAVRYARRAGDPLVLARSLYALAQAIGFYQPEDLAIADGYAIEAIALARAAGDPVDLAVALRVRGLTIDPADAPAKIAALEESLALLRIHGNSREVATGLTWLSETVLAEGDNERAYVLGREARRAAEASGGFAIVLTCIGNLAQYALAAREWRAAYEAALDQMRIAREARDETQYTWSIQVLACVTAAGGDPRTAARLFGFCDSRSGMLHPPRQVGSGEILMYEQFSAQLRERLGEADYAAEHTAGAALDVAEATSLALAVALPGEAC